MVLPVDRWHMSPLLPLMWELRDNLTAYDAAYVALAELTGAVLVTGDERITAAPWSALRHPGNQVDRLAYARANDGHIPVRAKLRGNYLPYPPPARMNVTMFAPCLLGCRGTI